MKIIIRDTGKEYPRKYKEGKEEYWEKALMKIWKNHMVKGVAPINEIDTVYIGNSSMPFNEIILFDGKRFYDEDKLFLLFLKEKPEQLSCPLHFWFVLHSLFSQDG